MVSGFEPSQVANTTDRRRFISIAGLAVTGAWVAAMFGGRLATLTKSEAKSRGIAPQFTPETRE